MCKQALQIPICTLPQQTQKSRNKSAPIALKQTVVHNNCGSADNLNAAADCGFHIAAAAPDSNRIKRPMLS